MSQDVQRKEVESLDIRMMTQPEARECADQIREHFTEAKILILELHDRNGWKALGYKSWTECVRGEFADSCYRAVQKQLEAARVATEIEDACNWKKFPVVESDKVLGDTKLINDSECEIDPSKIPDSHLIALGKLPSEERIPAYKEAEAGTSKEKPTTAEVQKVVNKRLGKTCVNGKLLEGKQADDARRNCGAPDDADVDITDPGDKATRTEDIAQEISEREAIEDEISDEEWLRTLPLGILGALPDFAYRIFRRDALLYRHLEPALSAFKKEFRPLHKEHMRGSRIEGAYAYLTALHFRRQHPKDWHRCPSMEYGGCDGTGTVGVTGQCHKCYGRGYLVQ